MIEKVLSLWERAKEKEPLYWMMWGPLFLLCTLTLVSYPTIRLGVLSLALLGFALCARFRMRGCMYAMILLAISSVVHHALIREGHFWILGLEISMGLAFLITALSAEEISGNQARVVERKKAADAAIENLELELRGLQESSSIERVRSEEQREALVRNVEEAEKEIDALLILNDVLRKAAARRLDEERRSKEEILFLEAKALQLQEEKRELELERERLLGEEGLARLEAERREELNQVRAEQYQTQLINETLAKLHAKEAGRAATLARELEEKKTVDVEEVQTLRDAVARLMRTEALYHQLREQFEEKSEVLHKTRQELFVAQTKLEASALEKEQEEPRFIEMERGWDALEEENKQLQELVTFLSGQQAEVRPLRKKKPKAIHEEQTPLFSESYLEK